MAGYGLLILVAVAGGIAVVFQSQFVGLLDQGLGSIESVFVTYVGGAILIGLIMLALRGGLAKRALVRPDCRSNGPGDYWHVKLQCA